MRRLVAYLEDPFLARLYQAVRSAGPLKSISVDLTHACNIRCDGCYFFEEQMDRHVAASDADFDSFIEREKTRGTNFVTVVGGEPSLSLDRLRKIYESFWMNVATNGLRRIPYDGFENMPIGVAVWGDHSTDRRLRGSGKLDVFAKALRNYRDDQRAFWYYTVAPGHAHEVHSVVEQCVQNGNRVLFNFYCDITKLGGELGHERGFGEVREAIQGAIERYPDRVLTTAYLAEIVSTGQLYDQHWGHAVCTSITPDHPANAARTGNGNAFNRHFRAYNADLRSTRRCCTGVDRSCESCFDTWEHFSWIMLSLRKHLGSKEEFSNWLTTMYLFYFINRIVDVDEGARVLPEIHARSAISTHS